MRIRSYLRWATLLVAAFGVACQEKVLGPAAQVRVTLTLLPFNGTAQPASIVAAQDSVVARSVISTSGCYDYAATGQAPRGQLALTLVATEAARYCTQSLTFAEAVVVSRGVPSGLRSTRLTERFVRLDGSTRDSELAHATIDVP